jgi:uncharacterized protein (DUF302 family)
MTDLPANPHNPIDFCHFYIHIDIATLNRDGVGRRKGMDMLYLKTASGSVPEVCAKVAAAAGQFKFGVLGQHDLRERMKAQGVDFPHDCCVLEVCNPNQAAKILGIDMSVSTMLPCRIAVYEQGGRTCVATVRPTALLALWPGQEENPIAREVEASLVRIIDAACA